MALVLGALLTATLAGVAGCAPEQTGPGPDGGVLQNPDPPAQGGGGASGANALVGDWQVVTLIPIGADFQTSTVTWHFASDGACRQTTTTLLVSEGIPRTTVRDCTWAPDLNAITVTFPGSIPATFSVSFAAFSADRLVLDGLEYARVA